jgi:hypothetical protein
MIPPEVRAARSRAWATEHLEECRQWGRIGNAVHRARRWDDLVDRWLDDDMRPVDAVREAYRRGYHAGYLAAERKVMGRKRKAA